MCMWYEALTFAGFCNLVININVFFPNKLLKNYKSTQIVSSFVKNIVNDVITLYDFISQQRQQNS